MSFPRERFRPKKPKQSKNHFLSNKCFVRTGELIVSSDANISIPASARLAEKTAFNILIAISVAHLLNDLIQSLIPSMYPVIKGSLQLDFGQVGIIQLTYQLTASILQPLVGMYTDRHPQPFSLPIGMAFSLVGILLLSSATSYSQILLSVALIGVGSSVFHPESSRVARMASGGKHGLAQSLFQVGGNAGAAFGPILAATFIIPRGQASLAWFSLVAFVGILVLIRVGFWTLEKRRQTAKTRNVARVHERPAVSQRKLTLTLLILASLVFSKAFYTASMTSYFTFYLIETFHLTTQQAQYYLFMYLASVAAGAFAGGPIGDRVGRKAVIWFSILGVLPFTLVMPHADLFWTGVLSIVIGFIMSSAFSAIIVYAQELMPGKVGMISGLFFGLTFGLGGLGAAILGELADHTSIAFVYRLCAFLPLIGILTIFLPDTRKRRIV